MDKFDFLEAMSGIRDEYIEDAAVFPEETGQQQTQGKMSADKRSGKVSKKQKILRMNRWAAAAAALLSVCVIAVAFSASDVLHRNDSRKSGFVTMSGEEVHVESAEETEKLNEETAARDDAAQDQAAQGDALQGETAQESGAAGAGSEMYIQEEDAAADNSDVSAAEAMSSAGISAEVRNMAEEEVTSFEDCLAEETGYPGLRFTHEVITDSDEWFSLKMLAYTGAEEGFEQVTHFNISRKDSEYVTLESLFAKDTDYITPLSSEVIRQMREQMKDNPDVEYWLDSAEGPEYDFAEISPAQDFYFDEDGNLVLCFNEGEAAPMYMGTVEFTIPDKITDSLLNT